MFRYCKIKALDLREMDVSNINNMQWMFDGCQAESIDLSNFDEFIDEDIYEETKTELENENKNFGVYLRRTIEEERINRFIFRTAIGTFTF